MEAIILAGGLGTRLRSVVNGVPKSMALLNNKPFLEYQLDRLISEGVSRFILSVGYKSDHIKSHFSDRYKGCEVIYAVEETLLGTGGAIKNAMKYVKGELVIVANGDSLFISNIQEQLSFHQKNKADITLALKPMNKFERYGKVELTENNRIERFFEKQPVDQGLINGGLYIFNVKTFNGLELPEKFSIEKDVFEAKINQLNLFGYISEGYFLDIGIPEDFMKARYEIGHFLNIDSTWTLFLDRDGVINRKRDNDYVKTISEFEFIPGTLEALANLSDIFGKIVVVTNQQGVGKGIMSEGDLTQIHDFFLKEVNQKEGRIDAIYHAPQLKEEGSAMRKPEIGMALKAKEEFPEIDFSKSIMVGDSSCDMEFGQRANMISIMVAEKQEGSEIYAVKSLLEFSKTLESILHPYS